MFCFLATDEHGFSVKAGNRGRGYIIKKTKYKIQNTKSCPEIAVGYKTYPERKRKILIENYEL